MHPDDVIDMIEDIVVIVSHNASHLQRGSLYVGNSFIILSESESA